jgi:prepilin-type N-terminal cleavage/methylation domain-containing protein
MDGLSICPLTCRHKAGAGPRPQGFSLLEMMMVVTLILIVASIATPIY